MCRNTQSQTTTVGGGNISMSWDQYWLLSYGTHSQLITWAVVRAMRQTYGPIRIPSMMTAWWTSPVSTSWAKLGVSQHQAVLRRNWRAERLALAATSFWVCLPSSHLLWSLATLLCRKSCRGLVVLLLQGMHFQRRVPAAVKPHFWSLALHVKQYRNPCFFYALFALHVDPQLIPSLLPVTNVSHH